MANTRGALRVGIIFIACGHNQLGRTGGVRHGTGPSAPPEHSRRFRRRSPPRESDLVAELPAQTHLQWIYQLRLGPGHKLLSNSKAVDLISEGCNVEIMFWYRSEPASGFDNAIFLGDIKAVPLSSDKRLADRRIHFKSGFERGSALQPVSSLRTLQIWLGSVHTNATGSAFGSVTSENSVGRLICAKVKFQ